ncbi:uncharacterized protein Hap1MRO34_004889 [Clarias gariepinus]
MDINNRKQENQIHKFCPRSTHEKFFWSLIKGVLYSQQNATVEKKRECLIKALCVYLNEEPDSLFKEYLNTDGCAAERILNMLYLASTASMLEVMPLPLQLMLELLLRVLKCFMTWETSLLHVRS